MLGLGLGINKHKVSGGIEPVLEAYGIPAAAYSLRYIYPTIYSGDVVLVRRSSDNAEEGFTPEKILDGTLVSFCGAGNGFVKTWYDQSGKGYDAAQSDTSSQPRIVNGGVLVESNGKPAMDQPVLTSLSATITNLHTATNLSSFIVSTPVNAATSDNATATLFRYADGGNGGDKGISYTRTTGLVSGEKFIFYLSGGAIANGRLGSSTYSNTPGEQILFSLFNLSSGTYWYKNSSAITINLTNAMGVGTNSSPSNAGSTSDVLTILKGYANEHSPNKYQEMIFFTDNKTGDRTNIEANIADYYGITLS